MNSPSLDYLTKSRALVDAVEAQFPAIQQVADLFAAVAGMHSLRRNLASSAA